MFSSDPTKLTNNGDDTSTGYGARIGYHGKFGEYFGVGASYQTKIAMGEFDDYAGLFAEQGDFDIPANWTVGIAVFPSKCCDRSPPTSSRSSTATSSPIGNPMLPNLMQAPLGADGGAGFGWEDVTVFKIGAQYEVNRHLDPPRRLRPLQPADPRERGPLQHPRARRHRGPRHDRRLDAPVAEERTPLRPHARLLHSVEGANPLEAPGQQTIKLTMDQWECELGFSFGF